MGDSAGAQVGEGWGLTALRQLCSFGVEHEPVVAIARRGQADDFLQQPVHRGRSHKIASPHDVGYALKRVVHRHRQMIARRDVASAENDVAPALRFRDQFDGLRSLAEFGPDEPA